MKTLKRILKYILILTISLAIWTFIIVTGTLKGWWHTPISDSKTADGFIEAVKQKTQEEFVGNFAMATIENGIIAKEYYTSKGATVNKNTVFQLASLSKWISAFGIMKLVEEGKLDLDTPVNKYLTRWHLPENGFNNDGVTVRTLLSHTAGLTDQLGYSGFEYIEDAQSLEESLTKASDGDEGISGEVKVGIEPGSEFKYSGGGYTLLQLIVEEVSGQSFSEYMRSTIFLPLGMENTSYQWDDISNNHLAEFYNADGSAAKHYRYTSLAATSLYSSISDLQIFFNANLNNTTNIVLSKETIKSMREPQATTMGMDIWGLGTILYAKKDGDYIIGHDGKSTPPINTAIRLNPINGNGIIVLETGSTLLASSIASEWVYWSEGKIDLVLFTMKKEPMVSTILLGWLIIFLILTIIGITRYFKIKKLNK
ncbi:MAG: CubicO group peptidase (beta-lactamase class C family) [Psychroserpens sp.]|jgi:CubicO group peptidase (beta-lactamase class C family)